MQVLPGLVSTYRWEAELQTSDEVLMLVKFACGDGDVVARLEQMSKEHPYELPEFLSLPVDACGEAYGSWLAENSSGGADGDCDRV